MSIFDPKIITFEPYMAIFNHRLAIFDPKMNISDRKEDVFDPSLAHIRLKVGHFELEGSIFDPILTIFDLNSAILT